MKIQGIIPPVATPMQANEDLDLPRLKWFLDHLITSGVHEEPLEPGQVEVLVHAACDEVIEEPLEPGQVEVLDLPRLKWFLDHLITSGVHGVFVLGTNSEFYALDDEEKQQVIATAVQHVRGRVPVYAGTGAETTREAVRLTRMAEKDGADA